MLKSGLCKNRPLPVPGKVSHFTYKNVLNRSAASEASKIARPLDSSATVGQLMDLDIDFV